MALTDAGEMLYFYGALVDMSNEKALPSYWGKLACSILNQDWDAANDDMNKLKDLIDSNSKSSPLQVFLIDNFIVKIDNNKLNFLLRYATFKELEVTKRLNI